MRGMMTLFRKSPSQPEYQALIQAPSADLIKPDTAPEIPEMVEIKCELTPEQLDSYMGSVSNTKYQNNKLETENLRHLLKKLGYKQYDKQSLLDFVQKTERYTAKKEGQRKIELYTSEDVWNYIDYDDFIPPLIINKICGIRSNFTNPDNLKFTILGFSTYNFRIRDKNQFKIFFLTVAISQNKNKFIIDAWRGPTFSDEEARLP